MEWSRVPISQTLVVGTDRVTGLRGSGGSSGSSGGQLHTTRATEFPAATSELAIRSDAGNVTRLYSIDDLDVSLSLSLSASVRVLRLVQRRVASRTRQEAQLSPRDRAMRRVS